MSNIFFERYKEMGHDVKPISLVPSIRTNLLSITNDELKSRLTERGVKLKRIPFTKNGFYVKSKFSIGSTPEYLLGHYYIQEAASQLPAEILGAKGIAVDCCAAPGGKTTQLAASSEAVLAFESHFKRMQVLRNNLERLGVKNCIVYNEDSRKIEGKYDSILLDAPCSGNMVTDPNWLNKHSLDNIKQRSKLQKEILGNMLKCLNDGGNLVYSTCSLEPEENEAVIDWALNNFDVKLVPFESIGSKGITEFQGMEFSSEVEKCRRLWPDETKTQGFFIAKFKK